jgi:hypothetical protein
VQLSFKNTTDKDYELLTIIADFPQNDYEKDFEGRATYEQDVTDLGHQMMGWPEVRIEKDQKDKKCQG